MNNFKSSISEGFSLAIPMSVSNTKLPDPGLLEYYKDVENRTLWIDSEIDEDILFLCKYIIRWNYDDIGLPYEERIPIRIMINSPGGEVDAAMALIDIFELSETPIYTYNIGGAHSAAGYIFMSGHKRFILKSSQILIHAGSVGGLSGSTGQVMDYVENFKILNEKIKNLIVSKTKITPATYKKNQTKEWFLNAEECVSCGVADSIIENIKDIID